MLVIAITKYDDMIVNYLHVSFVFLSEQCTTYDISYTRELNVSIWWEK